MTLASTLSIASIIAAAAALSACATSAPKPAAPAAVAGPLALTGSNGDLRRYLGTWTSSCGKDFTAAAGGMAQSSGINSFELATVAGRTVQGTLTVETYPTTDCTGSPARSTANVALNYAGTVAATDVQKKSVEFSGTADRISATITGGNGNSSDAFNVGFFDNFSRFKLSPVDYFSAVDLVYTKKPAR